jgi:hypothetical protein
LSKAFSVKSCYRPGAMQAMAPAPLCAEGGEVLVAHRGIGLTWTQQISNLHVECDQSCVFIIDNKHEDDVRQGQDEQCLVNTRCAFDVLCGCRRTS